MFLGLLVDVLLNDYHGLVEVQTGRLPCACMDACPNTCLNMPKHLPEHMRDRYKKESKWICDTFRRAFLKANQMEVFDRVFQLFQCGILGDEDAMCDIDNGVFAYWALLSLMRPVDEEYRNLVEEKLNRSFMLLYKQNLSWDHAIAETRPYVVEAKRLGIRIKWMYTGRKWP